MKRMMAMLSASAVFLCLGTLPALAQHGGGGGHAGGMGGGAGMGGDQGMGGSMGHGGTMGSTHGNGNMGESGTHGQSVSNSSPTSLLSSNVKLASTLQTRLGSMLPAGMSLTQAASGFKNLGQFIAALHVSHNLDIPFSDLKDKMTSGDSLGKAIHTLKPQTNSKAEAKKGTKQAKNDLKESRS